MLTIEPYDPMWPEQFCEEATRLRSVLGPATLRIEHVGSTSVPGLPAKPVIDIQVSVASLEPLAQLAKDLEGLGYTYVPVGDFDKVYPFFTKPAEWPSTHHVHVCVSGGEQEAKHLAFRDYLRNDPTIAVEYVKLKRVLAASHHGTTLESRENYSRAKSEFVQMVLQQAASEGYVTGGAQ
ncbi:MAG: hypothetical protein HW412_644 [Bacteroidetes bacterium]|nr:hypothetical protein [Bacteroidota bacterium]